jgi:nicotinamidase-related amidase
METSRSDENWQLTAREECCLVVIDVQGYFLEKLPLDWREPLVERMAWLMRVARSLDVPIIATAEDVEIDGPLVAELAELMPKNSPPILNKMVFGLYGQEDTRAAVDDVGRSHFVLVGLETDVCVAQSALGLRQAGYRVSVVEDACGSPPPNHDVGIQRMREAGVVVTSTKALYYEWVRDLENHHRVQAELNAPLPAGMTL